MWQHGQGSNTRSLIGVGLCGGVLTRAIGLGGRFKNAFFKTIHEAGYKTLPYVAVGCIDKLLKLRKNGNIGCSLVSQFQTGRYRKEALAHHNFRGDITMHAKHALELG